MRNQLSSLWGILFLNLCLTYGLAAQEVPVILELEDGTVGADFTMTATQGVTYLSISTNWTAGHPENDARVVTLEVTFPAAQTYDLYARVRIGAAGAEDDSFFYGNGFGQKAYNDADWIRVNNIHSIGYTGANDCVDGAGVAGQGVWKWINLSEYNGDEAPLTFDVSSEALTQTIQIGARETGLPLYVTELDIDGPTDQTQLSEYQRVFPVFWEHPAVRGITLWGFRPGMWRTEQQAYLIDQDGITERPALEWLRDYVQNSTVPVRNRLGVAEHIMVYPNPVSGGFIRIQRLEKAHDAQVYAPDGRLVQQLMVTGDQLRLAADLSPGLYILKLFDGRRAYSKKLMVK